MDTDDLEPPKKNKLPPPVLEEMSIEELGEYIEELEAAIAGGSAVVGSKEKARGTAASVFKT
jgi:uncharacterized small protein (DUF1192 family)